MCRIQRYELVFASELQEMKKNLNKVLALLKNTFPKINESDIFDLHLIYSELLCNAVVHGNKKDRSKSVKVVIEFGEDTIRSVIQDEGIGFDYNELMNNANNDPTSCHGRGVMLVNALSDALDFNRVGNEITFLKKVAMSGQDINM